MIRKYFPLDKNYILEGAQLDNEEKLVIYMVNFVKGYYQAYYNPLGLEDETIKAIKAHDTTYVTALGEFYQKLCGIYRHEHGDNQLQLLFDGEEHYDRYVREWKQTYKKWLEEFCQKPNFIKAVFEQTVLKTEFSNATLAENRLKVFVEQHFGLKLYKYRGIVKKAS